MIDDETNIKPDEDSSSMPELRNNWTYVKNAPMVIDHYFTSGIYQLEKLEKQRDKKIEMLESHDLEIPDPEMYLQLRIMKLMKEIANVKWQIENLKPNNEKNVNEKTLIIKNDFLKIEIQKYQKEMETLERKYRLVKASQDQLVDLMKNMVFNTKHDKEYFDLQENLKHCTNDLEEAKVLQKELQKIGWSMLPNKLADSCETIDDRMENLKLELEELQIIIFKKKNKLSKYQAEIAALNTAIAGERKIKIVFEEKINSSTKILAKLKEQLANIVSGKAKILPNNTLLNNPLDKTKEIKSTKPFLSKNNQRSKSKTTVDEDDEYNEDQIKYLQTRLNDSKRGIIAAKETVEKERKNFELVKVVNVESNHLLTDISELTTIKKALVGRLNQEILQRKEFYNQIEDLKGAIRVYCRCRPLNQNEITKRDRVCVNFPDVYSVLIIGQNNIKREFQFDKVYGPNSTQTTIFDDTSKLIQSAFDGFNVCIFAYGQTGSGKTHTLIGDIEENPGIVLRVFDKIFSIVEEEKLKFKTQVMCCMLELYNEKLLDLLTAGANYSEKLDIKRNAHGMVVVLGAETVTVSNPLHLKDLFIKGNSNRHIAATKMNAESSRSHLIISMMLTCQQRHSDKLIRGKISIIDLAGSEKISKSGVKGVGVQEALAINMSLSALGDVIAALTTGQTFIPYRNNKLTMLMQDSIGGNAKTLMFVNISPTDFNIVETMSSLTYGTRVKLIRNENTKLVEYDEVVRLENLIGRLKKGEHVVF